MESMAYGRTTCHCRRTTLPSPEQVFIKNKIKIQTCWGEGLGVRAKPLVLMSIEFIDCRRLPIAFPHEHKKT